MTDPTHEIQRKLTVAGHFANGLFLSRDGCLALAKYLEQTQKTVAAADTLANAIERVLKGLKLCGWALVGWGALWLLGSLVG